MSPEAQPAQREECTSPPQKKKAGLKGWRVAHLRVEELGHV